MDEEQGKDGSGNGSFSKLTVFAGKSVNSHLSSAPTLCYPRPWVGHGHIGQQPVLFAAAPHGALVILLLKICFY